MIPIDRYIEKKRMIAWPSVVVGRREAGDVRISFFFFWHAQSLLQIWNN